MAHIHINESTVQLLIFTGYSRSKRTNLTTFQTSIKSFMQIEVITSQNRCLFLTISVEARRLPLHPPPMVYPTIHLDHKSIAVEAFCESTDTFLL